MASAYTSTANERPRETLTACYFYYLVKQDCTISMQVKDYTNNDHHDDIHVNVNITATQTILTINSFHIFATWAKKGPII